MTTHVDLSTRRLINITDLAELAGVSQRTLRYYEDEGLISARRDVLNVRCYDGRARDRVLLVVRLRRAGLSLKNIRDLLHLYDSGKPISEFVRRRVAGRLRELKRERETILAALDGLSSLDAASRPLTAFG